MKRFLLKVTFADGQWDTLGVWATSVTEAFVKVAQDGDIFSEFAEAYAETTIVKITVEPAPLRAP